MARFVVALVAVVVVAGCADERPIRPSDISLADGFRIEALVEELNAPTMVAFDDQGRMLIAESGYHGGGESRVSRLEPDGSLTVLAGGDAFGDEVPVTSDGCSRPPPLWRDAWPSVLFSMNVVVSPVTVSSFTTLTPWGRSTTPVAGVKSPNRAT